MTSRSALRMTLLLGVLCVAVPSMALVARVTVYFAANFNASSAPGPTGITAEVGSMEVTGPSGVFTVVQGSESGMLRIADGGLATDASLKANLKQLFKGTEVCIQFELTASQSNSGLTLRAEDDADSGLIDVGFDGSGGITVDGEDSGESYQENVTYEGELRLRDALVGESTWHLVLQSELGDVISLQGQMKSDAPLRMEDLQIIRAAGGAPGEFFLDDLRVTSSTLLPNY